MNNQQQGQSIDSVVNEVYAMTTGINNFIASSRRELIAAHQKIQELEKEIAELKGKKEKK